MEYLKVSNSNGRHLSLPENIRLVRDFAKDNTLAYFDTA